MSVPVFDVFIGLEIHAQLLTNSKMFCECPAAFEKTPNVHICPTCLGYPGTLPVPNGQAVRYAYRVAHALGCKLAPVLHFDRKNYFYPDLAKNYQISQFHHPVGTRGTFNFFHEGEPQNVGIIQAHLEEDAGKLIHTDECTLCDYNRAGTALMEIVTAPEIKTPQQAESVLRQFRRLVRYLGVCDGTMEEGSLRCDANISINKMGQGLGKKVEVKNMNSFRFVRLALEYEIQRQRELLEAGKVIEQQTRLWNENKGLTIAMRSKEHASDYRYFSEPDISPIRLSEEFFDDSKSNVELPFQRAQRMAQEHDLDDATLAFLLEEKTTADFFEQTVSHGVSAKLVATWCMSDVQKFLHRYKREFGQPPLTPKRFAWMLAALESQKIHGKLAKQILEKVFEEDRDPEEIVQNDNLTALSSDDLAVIVSEFIAVQAHAVQQYKDGNTKILGFFMGQIMKKTQGKAEPAILQEMLVRMLNAQ